jgi:hypothetical protein
MIGKIANGDNLSRANVTLLAFTVCRSVMNQRHRSSKMVSARSARTRPSSGLPDDKNLNQGTITQVASQSSPRLVSLDRFWNSLALLLLK